PKKEVTALASDAKGNIYAAGAGDKRGGGTSSATGSSGPATVTPQTTIVIQQAPPATAAGVPGISPTPYPNVVNVGGSEIYRISPDGSPRTIWSSKDDLVYTMAFDDRGRLIA